MVDSTIHRLKPLYINDEAEARRVLAHIELDIERLRNPAMHIVDRVREREMIMDWSRENGWQIETQ